MELKRQLNFEDIIWTSSTYWVEIPFNLHTRKNYSYSIVNKKAFNNVPAPSRENVSLLDAFGVTIVIVYRSIKGHYNALKLPSFVPENLSHINTTNSHDRKGKQSFNFHHIPYAFYVAIFLSSSIKKFLSALKSSYRDIDHSSHNSDTSRKKLNKYQT